MPGAVPARIVLAGASFSDAAKLEYNPDNAAQIRLKRLLAWSEDFADLSAWTKVDSGTNVNLAGGIVSMNGNDAGNANGIYKTTGLSVAEGYLEFKAKGTLKALNDYLGISSAAALETTVAGAVFRRHQAYAIWAYAYYGLNVGALGTDVSSSEWLTFRIYVLPAVRSGSLHRTRLTVQGGSGTSGFALATALFDAHLTLAPIPATFYPMFQRILADAELSQIKEIRWYTGLATDDPVATLADINAGAPFSVWDMSAIAFDGSTTGLTFSYACGDTAAPSNWSAYLTLAQLQAEADPAGQFFRLRCAFSSDSATQRTLTEGTVTVSTVGRSANFGRRIRV